VDLPAGAWFISYQLHKSGCHTFWINHIAFMVYTTFLCYIMHWWTSFLLDNMTSINVGVGECFSCTDHGFFILTTCSAITEQPVR
jgi:hypothetical protein